MNIFAKRLGLGDGKPDEESDQCIKFLYELKNEIAAPFLQDVEIFDPGLRIGLDSEKTIEGKLNRLSRMCIWHAILLNFEFKVKLLYTIDGYISAVETQNPVSTFLMARYLLELAATVSAIDFELDECMIIDFHDWQQRGMAFLAALYRARHSTSDPIFKDIFAKAGIPEKFAKPIRIGHAIKKLMARRGFGNAVAIYDTLSNICHHNGSAHKLFAERVRWRKTISSPSGKRVSWPERAAAATIAYPSLNFIKYSKLITARPAWWCAEAARGMLDELHQQPYTDDELALLTHGGLVSARLAYDSRSENRKDKLLKLGRNNLCHCGSGRKYKACCWKSDRQVD